jgi:regulator of replication initiation timing
MYKVKKEDLIREIEGFPIEVVQAMVNEQERQGNEPDVSVFQDSIRSNQRRGGFDWDLTDEDYDFWFGTLKGKDFDLFFKKYPEKEDDKTAVDVDEKELQLTQAVSDEGTKRKIEFSLLDNVTTIYYKGVSYKLTDIVEAQNKIEEQAKQIDEFKERVTVLTEEKIQLRSENQKLRDTNDDLTTKYVFNSVDELKAKCKRMEEILSAIGIIYEAYKI